MELILLTFIFVVIFSLFYVKLRTRRTCALLSVAKKNIQQRAKLRTDTPIDDALLRCHLDEKFYPEAKKLLNYFASLIDVPVEKFSPEQQLRDVFTYKYKRKFRGDIESLEPFTIEIIENVSSMCEKELWEKQWRENPELPRNESDFGDFIMAMDIGSFIKYYAPIMKKP
ncbi:MAG: hypothetical protein KZQ90_10005 [Candidatus Thiodiazotropha sp. (ex Codakia rugifera)]|nr:hypothetical protein [Candidatus Thiodiazotropha sp. (ex Codakia rugifera)]